MNFSAHYLNDPKLKALLAVARLDKPVGTLLLLWPTLAALWIAAFLVGRKGEAIRAELLRQKPLK